MNKIPLQNPTILIILDGFGIAKQRTHNAIQQAKTPFLHYLNTHYPHTTLQASGGAVGLPDGYVGNSEVGHLTIGSGRIIKQPVTRINEIIDHNLLEKNKILIEALTTLKTKNKKLHIMGLLSGAGVHSHEKHLYAYLKMATDYGVAVIIHAFLDGRDAPPQSAAGYLEQLEKKIWEYTNGTIGTLHGRFYAMDRDNNWNRTQKSYQVLTDTRPTPTISWQDVLAHNYSHKIYDEFIPPTRLNQYSAITDGDGVLFFNVRPDRARQLTSCFTDPSFDQFPTKRLNLSCFMIPVPYDHLPNTQLLFEQPPITNTLKEIVARHNKTIFAIAETEKYAHVTYFFSGGQTTPLKGETQLLIPSLKEKNYIEHPGMSAQQITDAVIHSLKHNQHDFYIINYANADMVGHSGNLPATIRAIECLDAQLKQIYEVVIEHMHGTLYITADHGNAEQMFDPLTNQPHTQHTTNPVPFIFVNNTVFDRSVQLNLTQLCDIAPFILKNMGLVST